MADRMYQLINTEGADMAEGNGKDGDTRPPKPDNPERCYVWSAPEGAPADWKETQHSWSWVWQNGRMTGRVRCNNCPAVRTLLPDAYGTVVTA